MKKQLISSGEQKIINLEQPQSQEPTPQKQSTQQLTAYQLFMKDKKNEGKFSLQLMAQMWKELPLDYKEQYQQKARELKEQYSQQKQADPETFFPISRLKTILKEDDERPQFRNEGYLYMLKAIEGFGTLLLNKVKDQVKQESRKIFKEDDLITIIKENQEFKFLDCLAIHHQKKKTNQEKNKQTKEKTVGALDKFLDNNNNIV